jgi:uncharacterized protein YkwD
MGLTQRILLVSLGAVIALALQPLFPTSILEWVDQAQGYVLDLKRKLTEPQPAPPSLDFPIPDHTETTPTPTPALFTVVIPIATPTVTPEPTPVSNPSEDVEQLRNYMLNLINEDRQEHGLSPVVLGNNTASQQHAEDTRQKGYSSHWGMNGLLPYMRYTLAGGVNYEAENWFSLRRIGGFLPLSSQECLDDAEVGLMDSPGHRRNILNKWHKKVNLGIAYDWSTCSVVQQFEGDYIEFSKEPTISDGILSFAGKLKGEFAFEGVDVWYDQPPHPLTFGQLDATYSYSTGQKPATFLREPLTGGYYYPDSSATFTWESGVDPYSLDPNTPRRESPPPHTYIARSQVVPWTTATVWQISGQSFRVQANISPVINQLGPGVYTVLIWGESQGESVALTNYSIFIE